MNFKQPNDSFIPDHSNVVAIPSSLLACPFCGQAPLLIKRGNKFDVACTSKGCYLEFGAAWSLTRKQAVNLWNSRK